MAVNGIGSYGIAGPSRKRTRGLQDYQQEVQAGNNINAYSGMGTRSPYQRGLQSTADHAIGGGALQPSWRTMPESTGQFNSLVANRGLNYGPDPRYPVQQDFGQARKPMPIPGTTAMGRGGQNLGRGLMSMGGPVDADTDYPRYTEGNVLNSGTRVSYDADRNSMRLTGPVSTADWMKQRSTTGPAAAMGLTNAEAMQLTRDRANSREQDFRDGRVLYNAKKYGLPSETPAVAAARQRSGLKYPMGGNGPGMKRMLDEFQAGMMKQDMDHNISIMSEIDKLHRERADNPGNWSDDAFNKRLRALQGLLKPIGGPQARGQTPQYPSQPSSGLPRPYTAPHTQIGGGFY